MSDRSIPASERLKLWVRAGGRCEICNRYLLEGQMAARELTFGEAAHIIGQKASSKSPRGLAETMTAEARDNADNLMLVCDDEHDELDKPGSSDAFSAEFLREMKRRHEDRVRHVTGFSDDHRTTPIRVIGDLRGNSVEVNRDAVASAVMATANRMPRFDLSTRHAVEIDLRNLPGEEEASPQYYATAVAVIDRVMKEKVPEAISNEDITHMSVFGFARIPLLVHLGARLDDTVPVDVYQRNRTNHDWMWLDPDATVTFSTEIPEATTADEAVLILNVSGTINRSEIPDELADLPVFELAVDALPIQDILAGPRALAAFERACRDLLSTIERDGHKHIRLLHVLPAIPLSAAITLGRVAAPEVHPSMAIYDRGAGDRYIHALTVGAR